MNASLRHRLLSLSPRVPALAGMALVHILLALLLLSGLAPVPLPFKSDVLKTFDVSDPLPPEREAETTPAAPEPLTPDLAGAPEPEGAPAPPAREAEPTPIVAPPAPIRIEPPPLPAAPVAGTGSAARAGAAPVDGPGTGAGGTGTGRGAGGAGAGSGGGGAAVRTRRVSGRISAADYPRAAERARAQGTVVARLTVGPDGRVSRCAVRVSSGSEALDETTCQLIHQRFRFTPARDANGRPVSDLVEWEQVWDLRQAKGADDSDPEADERRCRARADALPGDRRARRALFFQCMAEAGWTRR